MLRLHCFAEDFTGWKAEFKAGGYDYGKMVAQGAKNDDASSIKVEDVSGTQCFSCEIMNHGGVEKRYPIAH